MNAAAKIIQHQWRLFMIKKEEEQDLKKTPTQRLMGDVTMDESELPSEEEQLRRLLDEYADLLSERKRLVEKNIVAQRSVSKHFLYQRIRKGENEFGQVPMTLEADEAYWASVRKLGEERRRVNGKKIRAEMELEAQRKYHQGTIDEAISQEEAFLNYIREIGENAVFMRSSSAFSSEMMDEYINKEKEQRQTIQSARVRYFQLQNFLAKLKRWSNDSDQGHDGMFLIDFEQLKIENTNLNEKIEERNEDLVKLRRKVTTTIHVLTHVKEKLEFMKSENMQLRQQVQVVEEELNGARDQLAQTKRKRDGFLKKNLKMKEKMPLVGSEDLLLDYELRKEEINRTRIKVVDLTERHKELLDELEKQRPIIAQLRKEISRCPT